MSRAAVLAEALKGTVGPALVDYGFKKAGRMRWRRRDLEVRVVVHSKAVDPFQGGAFTLEFERSPDGRFGVKLAGQARVDQLLDVDQRRRFLATRNAVASRLPGRDAQQLAVIPEFLRERYLKAFDPATEIEPHFFMSFRTAEDALEWGDVLASMVSILVDRAETLDPHALVLGEATSW